ncbi:M16 family metallopeptidase [Steroidobacter flavus]|uniref:M16 family metallopeptidase n=1 Tax=Steroidobacter flavus TaxID=1842136 RepID=A0ABV8T379_9GAMM
MRLRHGLLTLALCAVAGVSPAQPAAPAVELNIPFEKLTLPNGLQVILVEDRRLPVVATNLRFQVGSGDDPPGKPGFAHLFEHLYAFSPPESVPSPQSIGATQDGATTDPDRTTYYTTAPSDRLETLLALESERWRNFPRRLNASLLAKERSNVRNERRLNIENQPYGLADEAVFQQLFAMGHPYHWKYLGTHAGVEAARLEDMREFFARYYGPGNASLVIAGDIDRSRARSLVEKYFGSIEAGAVPPRARASASRVGGQKRITVTDRVEVPRVTLAWATPGWYQPGNAEMEMLSALLGSSSSRLYDRLVRQEKLANSLVVEHLPFARGSVLAIKAAAAPGVTLQRLESAIASEMAAFQTAGPSAAEVEQARNATMLSIVRGLEKLGEINGFGDFTMDAAYGGVAEQLNQCNVLMRNPGCLREVMKRFAAATPDSLRKAAATLTPGSGVVIYAVPGEKVVDDVPAAEAVPASSHLAQTDKFEMPPVGPPSAVKPPAPQRVVLDNGFQVWLVEQHQIPAISAHLVVRRGSGDSPANRAGLAAFTTKLLLRGTRERTSREFALEAAQLGTKVEADISSDAAALGIRVLKQNLPRALGLLSDAAMNPAFSQADLDSLRAEELARIAQARSNVDTRASYLFTETLYGGVGPYRRSGLFNDDLFARAHNYGYDEIGTEEALRAITRDEIARFWKEGYTPDNVALVVAGDASLAELRELATKYFGAWQGKAAKVARAAAGAPKEHYLVENAGNASQTALRVGTIGATRSSPDLVPLRLLNFVFGEIFESRITANLRVKHNYTYMARSQFAFRREPGPFVVGTNVRTDVTASALQELFNELSRLREEPVSDAEMRFARTAYESSLVSLFESTGKMASTVGQMFTYELPLDYYQALPTRIGATTAADIQRVARQYLQPSKVVVVAVGDQARIEPGIANVVNAATRGEP